MFYGVGVSSQEVKYQRFGFLGGVDQLHFVGKSWAKTECILKYWTGKKTMNLV